MLLDRMVRQRLAALSGGATPVKSPAPGEAVSAPPSPELLPARGPVQWIPPAVRMPEGRAMTTALGPVMSYRLRPEDLGGWALAACEAALGALAAGGDGIFACRHGFCVCDIETTGLSASPIFLVGLLHAGCDGAHIHQFLARDYSEEPAALLATVQVLGEAAIWLSFNGRSFDIPYIRDRLRYHQLGALPEPAEHRDLLHAVRRAYREQLPDCRLQTIETQALGRGRLDDILGAMIPDAYRRYVLDGETQTIRRVLQHNALDLIAVLEIAARLAPAVGRQEG